MRDPRQKGLASAPQVELCQSTVKVHELDGNTCANRMNRFGVAESPQNTL
jgi:hypothetical protein